MSDKIEKTTGAEIEQNEGEFFSQINFEHPLFKFFGCLVGDLMSVILQLSTGGWWSAVALGAIIAFTLGALYFFSLSYAEFRRKRNLIPISIIPNDVEKELNGQEFNQEPKLLENKVPEQVQTLDIVVQDIYLLERHIELPTDYVIMTFVLEITNERPEATTIRNCKLTLDYKDERIDGELMDTTYFTCPDYMNKLQKFSVKGGLNPDGSQIVFLQGILQVYRRSFKFPKDKSIVSFAFDKTQNYSGAHYQLEITDSYKKTFHGSGILPDPIEAHFVSP